MVRRRVQAEPTAAVIYCRVSTERQAREGIGLDAQERVCREFAERRGWTIDSSFRDEGISGREDIDRRPGLAAALDRCGSENAVLVVYSLSRVARRQRLLWSLLDPASGSALAIASATEPFDTSTPMGRAMLGMIAVWSQLEADMVGERTRDALAELRAQGKRLGTPPMIETVPEAVRIIGELRRSGLSLRAIAEKMTEDKIPTARSDGKRWYPKTVRAALIASGLS